VGLACELDVLLYVFLFFCLVSTCCSECRSSKENPSLYPEVKGVRCGRRVSPWLWHLGLQLQT
jgi:hypothetical protein